MGIVAGGGICLLHVAKILNKKIKKYSKDDIFKSALDIFLKVLKEPIKQILINAELDYSVIINKIDKNQNKNYGYDALNNKYCDMLNSGIIDPAKVTITALTNATSIVTTMLTTQAIITDKE